MKKEIVLIILILFLANYSYSQNSYALQNLEKLSLEDLNASLAKSQKIKKSGAILSIAAPITFATGAVLFVGSWNGSFGGSASAGLGFIMIAASPVLLLTGIPILITGATRTNRINEVIHTKFNNVYLDFRINSQFNYLTNSYHPGITLTMNF